MSNVSKLTASLLASVAFIALAGPADAADAATDAKIKALEAQVQALTQAVDSLKQNLAVTDNKAAAAQTQAAAAQTSTVEIQDLAVQVEDIKRSTSNQYADVQNQRAADVRVTIANARPVISSPDGRFTAQLRALTQYDIGYYSQPRAATAADLSSGTNFRRARFGLEGKAFGDWAYGFIYDFGGSNGSEQQGRISDSYIQYDGIRQLHFKVGSFAPSAGLEDQTGTGDLIFPERAAPADLARGIAAADGRQNFLSIFGNDLNNTYFGSLSLTGSKSADSVFFDEQLAAVGRAAYRIYSSPDANVLLSANATYVFKVPDTAASPAGASAITLQVVPESYVDQTKLISTGAINAEHVFQWGLEAGGNWKNVYGQGGYFSYAIDRRTSALPNPDFHGWYVQGTWVLTGETRRYNGAIASWAGPAPTAPFDLTAGQLGAWELAARYSDTDLNFRAGNAGSAMPLGGIRGGQQREWTLGLNWYPNLNVRFEFDYQRVNVERLGAAAPFAQIGQKLDVASVRGQVAF